MMVHALNCIEIRKNRSGDDRAFIVGTRLRVQDIVIDHQRFGNSTEQIAADYEELSLAQVHAALAYYFENRDAVQQAIRDDEVLTNRLENNTGAMSIRWPLLLRGDDSSDQISP